MVIIRFYIIIIFVIYSGGIFGQNKNTIQTNTVIYLFRIWNIQYERSINYKRSIQFDFAHTYRTMFFNSKMNGFLLTVNYKIFLPTKRRGRIYISPYVRYVNMLYMDNDTLKYQLPGGGLMLGRVYHPFSEFINIDFHAGINFMPHKKFERIMVIDLPPTFYGWGPRVGISIGFNF